MSIIESSRIWFSTHDQFNDPFDCLPAYKISASPAEVQRYIRRLLQRNAAGDRNSRRRKASSILSITEHRRAFEANIQISAKKIVGEVAILSLSSDPSHVLMWSHYADSHGGLCLRFKRGGARNFFSFANPVIYSDKRPVYDRVRDGDEVIVDKLLLAKAAFWSYEQEWRVLVHPEQYFYPPGGNGLVRFPSHVLDGIIFGAKTPLDNIRQIISRVRQVGLSLQYYKAEINDERYVLNIFDLDPSI